MVLRFKHNITRKSVREQNWHIHKGTRAALRNPLFRRFLGATVGLERDRSVDDNNVSGEEQN